MGKKGKKGKKTLGEIGKTLDPDARYMNLQLQIETLERELQVKSAGAEEAVRS